MENFILYEQLGSGKSSVVYKGRRKGSLSYVAIICTNKAKRPEISNHVRLSHDLDHPNIICFYEWYESSNHLWLVVELCTGGSLESVIGQDGCLPEDVVRTFGWDLVKGLKYVHELGIIFSDLTPAKILLDGSGILKFGNFCLSKLEGETLEDFFTLFVSSEEAEMRDAETNFSNMRKRLQGSLMYTAPEVLQGSENNMSSDLWALGCMLYYMYTGKPPFYSDSNNELIEMIVCQEPPPLRQTDSLPSEEFQNLLKALLNKNPEQRIDWPELLDHPFWAPVVKEEEDDVAEDDGGHQTEDNSCERVGPASWRHTENPLCPAQAEEQPDSHAAITQPGHETCLKVFSSLTTPETTRTRNDNHRAVRHTNCGALRNSQEKAEDDSELTRAKKINHTLQPHKLFTIDNVSELRPKSGVDEDNTEAIFLLSSCANSRRSCSAIDSLDQSPLPQASMGTDVTASVKCLLHTDSDLTVTPIMDNPKILRSLPVRFDPKTLCVPAHSVEKLHSLSDEGWTNFLSQLCSSLEEQNRSTHLVCSFTATAPPPPSSAARSKLNLLCYLCCVAGNKLVANKLINSNLLSVLIQQLRQAPNWDVRSKVLRVMGLQALHCTKLGEESPVSEAVSTMTELLRENQRNHKVKHYLLPPLGQFLYLIASQEEKRGSPEGLWFVPAAAYTGLMRSLREGDDPVVHHMVAHTIENLSTVVSVSSHHLFTSEMGSALWFLFTHSTVEAVRVTAVSSLSRLTRVVPAVFLAVIDTCGPAAILEGVGGAGARVQQHLLNAMATALVTSRIQTHHFTQTKDLVLKVLHCLESPSKVTRAKAILLLLLLIQDNSQILLYCCQHRLVMYLERDLCRATPLKANPNQSGYLSQCLDLLIGHLCSAAPLILGDVLGALRDVIGRRHPSTAQSRQLKLTLPTLSLVLELLSSQVFRSKIVTEDFLAQTGLLLNYVSSIESNETNLASAVGAAVCEELIRTSLSIVKVLSQHQAVITPHHNAVVDAILPPLTTLAFSRNVEWSVFVLRVLSELSLALLVEDGDGPKEDEMTEEKKKGRAAEETDKGKSSSQILALITESLLPRYESLLGAAEPIPLYALKLLVSMTEYSKQICRLIKHSGILPTVFQLIMANINNVSSGIVIQNAVALLCNLTEDTTLDLKPLHQQGLIEVVVNTLSEAAVVHQAGEEHTMRKTDHLVLQALLELLHNILKRTSLVVRSALKSQRLSCPAAEMEAAEKLLLANRPLSQLSTHLIHMLFSKNQEVWEESIQCLSLLVQLYGGEGHDCLSPSCLKSFSHVLRARMHTESTRIHRIILRIIKRLVQTTDGSDWLECPEWAELAGLLQDITTSNRPQGDVNQLAAEILQEISGS